jgi:hypothetical protein
MGNYIFGDIKARYTISYYEIISDKTTAVQSYPKF